MSAPIVYRWDDANAPVARGERRSLCDILHACLVTGYGSKPAAGWTREYVNATFDKAVFRNNPSTGTGFYLQVNAVETTNARRFRVQGYEVMTSESDGLLPFNADAQEGNTSSSDNTTARPWILIADDRAVYLVIWPSITAAPRDTNTTTTSLYFGDVVSRYADDAYGCGLVCNGDYGSWGYTYQSTGATGNLGSSALAMPRRASGAAGSILPALVKGGGPCSAIMGQLGVPWTSGDQIILTRPFINEASAYTFRGFLPGFYVPCHPLSFGQLTPITVDSRNYLSIRSACPDGDINYFISLDDWRV